MARCRLSRMRTRCMASRESTLVTLSRSRRSRADARSTRVARCRANGVGVAGIPARCSSMYVDRRASRRSTMGSRCFSNARVTAADERVSRRSSITRRRMASSRATAGSCSISASSQERCTSASRTAFVAWPSARRARSVRRSTAPSRALSCSRSTARSRRSATRARCRASASVPYAASGTEAAAPGSRAVGIDDRCHRARASQSCVSQSSATTRAPSCAGRRSASGTRRRKSAAVRSERSAIIVVVVVVRVHVHVSRAVIVIAHGHEPWATADLTILDVLLVRP